MVRIQGRNSNAESWGRSDHNNSTEIYWRKRYLLHSHKQVPGRFDPQEVEVAEGGDDGEDGDDGDDEERLKRLAQRR